MGVPTLRAGPAFTYGLSDICDRLGVLGHGPAWQVRYVDRLIKRLNFPAPLPVMIGARMIEGAHRNSRWTATAVDRWFEDRLPPDAAAREDRAERRQAEAAMDARAHGLAVRLVRGGPL